MSIYKALTRRVRILMRILLPMSLSFLPSPNIENYTWQSPSVEIVMQYMFYNAVSHRMLSWQRMTDWCMLHRGHVTYVIWLQNVFCHISDISRSNRIRYIYIYIHYGIISLQSLVVSDCSKNILYDFYGSTPLPTPRRNSDFPLHEWATKTIPILSCQ